MLKKGNMRSLSRFFSFVINFRREINGSCIAALFLCCFLSWPVTVLSQEKAGKELQKEESSGKRREDIAAALDSIKRKIDREERRLRGVRESQRNIQGELGRIDKEYSIAVKEREKLQTLLRKLVLREKDLKEAIEHTESKIDKLTAGLRERIVAIYKMQRRTSSLDYLFRANSATDLLKRSYYLSAVARHDKQALDILGAQIKSFSQDKGRLNAVRKSHSLRLEEVRVLERKLENQKIRKASLLRKERNRAKEKEKALKELHRHAGRLESVLASIMGSDEKPLPPMTDDVPKKERKMVKAMPSPKPFIIPKYRGSGLRRLRGRLVFPVEGEVIQRFGRQKLDEFSDFLFLKGLEVRGKVGARVRAVHTGKVIFSKTLPGYGQVVIVDHGSRYYTLYGRLASVLCTVGEDVQEGTVLAVVGQTDSKGRNFYFELRIRGKATNPVRYFKKVPFAKGV